MLASLRMSGKASKCALRAFPTLSRTLNRQLNRHPCSDTLKRTASNRPDDRHCGNCVMQRGMHPQIPRTSHKPKFVVQLLLVGSRSADTLPYISGALFPANARPMTIFSLCVSSPMYSFFIGVFLPFWLWVSIYLRCNIHRRCATIINQ